MCGICGEITFNHEPASIGAVRRMNRAMAARGPDDEGLHAHGPVALGHRRLSIIDLTARGRQPMEDPALGLTVVFNGCIYNYRELRRELEAEGYRFFSDSDTEVVLKAWHAWGESAPERLFGMFAFAVSARDSGRVSLVRDRFGIKPLYFSRGGASLRFASTLPALLAAGRFDTNLDPVALQQYMTFHSVVASPRTLLAGVRKLPPATVTTFEPDGRTTQRTYWTLRFERDAEDQVRPAAEWRERVAETLRAAVDRRMVADVPVGVLLSGGLDSSLIVGMLAESGQSGLETFSIGFEDIDGETGNEFVYSDLVAERFGTRHHRRLVQRTEIIDALPGTIAAMSEPMVSYDNVAFHLLSRDVAEHLKVVQSGQGADEVFGGYHWYPPLVGSNEPVADYAREFFDRDHAEYRQVVAEAFVGADHALEFVTSHFAADGADEGIDKALRLDQQVMLSEDPVKRLDNMSMAASLEARVPFLDHEVVELAARIPAGHKLADGGKGILKQAARGIVPDEVIDRPKGYFPVPALKYIEGPVLDMVRDALGSANAVTRGLFRPDYVQALLDDPKAHITPLRGSKLWQLATLELWLDAQGA